jgi:hypothetical protein
VISVKQSIHYSTLLRGLTHTEVDIRQFVLLLVKIRLFDAALESKNISEICIIEGLNKTNEDL